MSGSPAPVQSTRRRRDYDCDTVKRIALTVGAALMAIGVGAGAYVHAQDQNTNPQPPAVSRPRDGTAAGRDAASAGRWACCRCSAARIGSDRRAEGSDQDHRRLAQGRVEGARRSRPRGALALDDAITADTVDEAMIRQKAADAAAVDADMAVARAHAHAEVLQILTRGSEGTAQDDAGGDEEADVGSAARTPVISAAPRITSASALRSVKWNEK